MSPSAPTIQRNAHHGLAGTLQRRSQLVVQRDAVLGEKCGRSQHRRLSVEHGGHALARDRRELLHRLRRDAFAARLPPRSPARADAGILAPGSPRHAGRRHRLAGAQRAARRRPPACPRSSVPVLSTISTSSRPASSSALAFLISRPSCAPRPVPTMIAVGVANPSAQGHAITSTATALTSAGVAPAPNHHVSANVSAAMATTIGTNTPADPIGQTRIGAFEPCTSATRRTMPASSVALPTPVASHVSDAVLVQGAGEHGIARRLGDRAAFTGEHAFVDGRLAGAHDAVDGDAFARPHHDVGHPARRRRSAR